MYEILLEREFLSIGVGVTFGIIARIIMLRTDYRQYPTYPHGKIIHVSLGIIAAGLGALVVPAIIHKEYTAVTFLALAAQQFRDVRNMERESLNKIEDMELVRRGSAYIEGIAMVFEGRNYLVILNALMASAFTYLVNFYVGAFAGIVVLFVVKHFRSGNSISTIADVRIEELTIENPELYVGEIYMMNIGLDRDLETIQKRGIGIIIKPKNPMAKVTLGNLGQRQAILHNLTVILGIYRDQGEPTFVPQAKLNLDTGELGIFMLPQEKDKSRILKVIQGTPVLESAVRVPAKY